MRLAAGDHDRDVTEEVRMADKVKRALVMAAMRLAHEYEEAERVNPTSDDENAWLLGAITMALVDNCHQAQLRMVAEVIKAFQATDDRCAKEADKAQLRH